MATDLVLTCECGRTLEVPAYMAGASRKCEGCGAVLRIPGGEVDAAPGSRGTKARLPWEERLSMGTLFATLAGFLVRPSRTYEKVDLEVPTGRCVLYVFLLSTAFAWIGSAVNRALVLGAWGDPEAAPAMLVVAAMAPVAGVVQAYAAAFIVHFSLRLLGEGEAGYDVTFRVVAYALGSTAVAQVVPFVGAAVAGLWALVLTAIGLRECQTLTPGKAVLVVLFPIALYAACGVSCLRH